MLSTPCAWSGACRCPRRSASLPVEAWSSCATAAARKSTRAAFSKWQQPELFNGEPGPHALELGFGHGGDGNGCLGGIVVDDVIDSEDGEGAAQAAEVDRPAQCGWVLGCCSRLAVQAAHRRLRQIPTRGNSPCHCRL